MLEQRRPAAAFLECRDVGAQLLDQFEAAWQAGPPPDIGAFLPGIRAGKRPAGDCTRQEVLHELVKIDLEYRWRRSDPGAFEPAPNRDVLPICPRLEDYLEHLPELGPLQQLPVALIGEEYRVRRCWGDRPNHAEYAARFPWQGGHLCKVLAEIDAELEKECVTEHLRGSRAPRILDNPPPQTAAPLRCPHCQHVIGVSAELLLPDLACPACGGTFSVESLSPMPGRTVQPPFSRLGRYELGELLGTGAFGSVWRARDTELGREVAIKLPRSGQLLEPAEAERFLREARSAARLHHPGIVAIHDVGRDQDTLYLVSDLVQGVSLAEWLRHRRLSFRETAELVAGVADALDFAHQRGVVHRDVKPSNIMLERVRDGVVMAATTQHAPRLMDFGLALRHVGEVAMTLDGQLLGTPAYISPEQLRNPHAVDGRSDLYSLGVILYELLTGERPFRGMTRMLLDQVLSEEPRPPRRLNDKIPRDLETICLKCLAKEPANRYRTAGALAADLRHWLAGEPIVARPVARVHRLRLWARRNRALAVTSTVAAVALAGSTGLAVAPVLLALVAVTIGSLLFAFHQVRARSDLAAALEEAGQRQRKTASALQFALQQCLQAREERNRAVAGGSRAHRQFALVRGLARALIFDLPDLIEGQGDSVPARTFLVQTALTYLNSLAPDVREDPLLLREVAAAYARLGEVQGSFTPAGPGDRAGALASYRRSMELFAALARTYPQNAQAQRDWTVSLQKVRELERSLGPARAAPVRQRKR